MNLKNKITARFSDFQVDNASGCLSENECKRMHKRETERICPYCKSNRGRMISYGLSVDNQVNIPKENISVTLYDYKWHCEKCYRRWGKIARFYLTEKQVEEYENLLSFDDYNFKDNWFDSILSIPDEVIYVICERFLYRYTQDKSRDRTDWEEIQAWKIDKEKKMAKKIEKGHLPKKLNDILFLLGSVSSCIMVRRQIPKIMTYKTIFGSFRDLLKLNRILFDRANYILKLKKDNE